MKTEFSTITDAVESVTSLVNFVDKGGVTKILATIGSVEYKAAILAFDNARKARNPAAEYRLAIGHLQSSHIAHKKLQKVSGNILYVLYPTMFKKACIKDCFSCALMAVCYAYLKEPVLARESIELAKLAAVSYHYDGLDSIMQVTNVDFFIGFGERNVLFGRLPSPEFFDDLLLKVVEIAQRT